LKKAIPLAEKVNPEIIDQYIIHRIEGITCREMVRCLMKTGKLPVTAG